MLDLFIAQADGAPIDGWAITLRRPRNPKMGLLQRVIHRVRFVYPIGRQDSPADSDHLVRKGDHRDLAVTTFLDLPKPRPERGPVSFQIQERGLRTLDEQLAQVGISTLTDPPEPRRASRRMLAWHEAKPGSHVTPTFKHPTIPDGRDQGRRNQRTHARHGHDATTQVRFFGPSNEGTRGLINLAVDGEPSLTKLMEKCD